MKVLSKHVFIYFSTWLFYACGDVTCPKCGGSGKFEKIVIDTVEYTEPQQYVASEKCASCYGLGATTCTYSFTSVGFMSSTTYRCSSGYYRAVSEEGFNTGLLSGDRCSECHGAGKKHCYQCSGNGDIKTTKTRYVKKYKYVETTVEEDDAYCEGSGTVDAFEELLN